MAMIIPGIVFLIIAGGLKTGIDFTGGSSMQIQFSDDVSQEDLRIKLEQEVIQAESIAGIESLRDTEIFQELNSEQFTVSICCCLQRNTSAPTAYGNRSNGELNNIWRLLCRCARGVLYLSC